MYHNLSHPQKRVWYTEKINQGSNFHNLGGCLKINSKVDTQILQEAINIIIKKNDGLRLKFFEKDGVPVQFSEKYYRQEFDFFDFSVEENSHEKFFAWSEGIFRKKFKLNADRLCYFAIYKVSEEEYGVLLNIHHIIADGWSINIIQNQICEFYNSMVNGKTVDELCEYSYFDFLERESKYLSSERFLKNKEFWKEKFQNIPESSLYKGSSELEGKREIFKLTKEESAKINEFLRRQGWSLNTFFIAAMYIYLGKMMQEDDIIIGTPVLNRSGRKEKNTIGMFTSTMPLKVRVDQNLSIEQFINQINTELKQSFYNQKYPYDVLVKDLELSNKGYDGLFKMSVNYYNTKNTDEINGIPVCVDEYYCGNQNYSLQLIIKEWEADDKITLSLDYKTSEYSNEYISNMYKYIMKIAYEIVNNMNVKIKDISLLNEDEIEAQIYSFNTTETEYPKDKTIIDLFEESVMKYPEKTAICFENKNLSYKDLSGKVNQMASYLNKCGVKKGSIVGIIAEHSIEMVIGLLGVMKAGGAYLPIDPSYPTERINYMIEDSGATVLLTNVAEGAKINFNGRTVDLNDENINSEYDDEAFDQRILGPSDLAYVIYTSGSTGKPKGVMIEQQGLVNYICWAKKMYLKEEDEVFALYSSISFDLTVTSIFTPLISGNTAAVYHDDGSEFILYKIINDNKATVVKLTPSHLTLLKDMDNSKSSIRRFVVGGENLKLSLSKKIYESFGSNIEILNEYGPTETVVGCMIHQYDPNTNIRGSVPIGVPADNVQIYILDDNLMPIINGAIGEIYVSGDGVARGYLNREALSKDRFIANPFIEGKRMYKTGDKGRFLTNGIIEYAGRSDNQVKIRGHRIELGEIEEYLLDNAFIDKALVIDKTNKNGDKVLYAYLIGSEKQDNSELKKWLSEFIPKYMIPVDFIYLESFPLTPNGKIDINNLPEGEQSEKEFIGSKNNLEESLVEVLKEILVVEEVSMNDNFYGLGGDSIKAIQIASKLKNKGFEIKVKDILGKDIIEEIAASIEISSENKIIDQDIQSGTIDNTPIIEWFFSQEFNNRNHYNQSVLLESQEKLSSDTVKNAMENLIEHHDILRMNYDESRNSLFYNNEHLSDEILIEEHGLAELTNQEQKQKIREVGNNIKSTFDINKDLMIRACIFNLDDNRQAVLITAHHLVVDGVSWRILIEDFISIIEQLKSGENVQLPLKTHSYKEWAKSLLEYGKTNISEEVFWTKTSESNFEYPVDYDSDENQVKDFHTVSKVLEGSLIGEFSKKINEIYGMDFNEALIIALVLTIHKQTEEAEVVIELEGHGRETIDEDIDVSRTIGWFTSIYPAMFRFTEPDMDKSIKSLKEQLRSIPNKGFDFGILKYLKQLFNEKRNQSIRFNYLGDFDSTLKSTSINMLDIDSGDEIDQRNHLSALIDINAMILQGDLKIDIAASKKKFKEETIEKFIDSFEMQIKEILDHCCEKEDKEYTPSDFEEADISQEDLDMLFE